MARPVIVGITGASGIVYGVRALQLLRECEVPTHLVMSKSAELTLHYEMDMSLAELKSLASEVHPVKHVGASIASGSFPTAGMLIAPCSVRTMSEIATGVTSTLLTRAADVVLKERRRLVLMVRETPLHTGHLRTMTQLSEIGAVIAFMIARLTGFQLMQKYIFKKWSLQQFTTQNSLTAIIFVSRLVPFLSFDLISYAAGLTPITLWRFALATFLGLIPASFLLAHFGGEMAGSSFHGIILFVLVIGLITAIPILFKAIRQHKNNPSEDQ